MSAIDEVTREKWIMNTFPEWGTWLNEDMEAAKPAPGTVEMWWLGCTGIYMKTPGNTAITIDLWTGNGKRTHGDGKMKVGHQMANMAGCRAMQPNLRNIPYVFDPFAIKHVDAVLATHYHQDHMSKEFAAHVIQSGMTTTDENGNEIPVPFIGPKKSVEFWLKWGVPAERCITVKPGDVLRVKDIEIVCLDSFDRTCLVTTDSTGPDREDLWGKCPMDMDEKAVNYLLRTPGGNIYHSGDSHYSIYFAKHGKDIAKEYGGVDVAFGSFGCNPMGMQDKMEASDIIRMAEALKPIAEYNTDSAALDREVKYLLSGTDTYATTYGGICAAAGEAYRMDLDAANHDAAVWTAVCAVLALAGIAGLVVSVTKIEYGRH